MPVNLINNIAFLIALVAAGQVAISYGYKFSVYRHILLGVLFGAVATKPPAKRRGPSKPLTVPQSFWTLTNPNKLQCC